MQDKDKKSSTATVIRIVRLILICSVLFFLGLFVGRFASQTLKPQALDLPTPNSIVSILDMQDVA